MSRNSGLRASDQDREQVAERLRMAAAEGRLSADELDQRLDAAFRARTYGDLDGLLFDLPSPGLVKRQSRPPMRLGTVIGLTIVLLVAAPVLMVAVLAALFTMLLDPPHHMAAHFFGDAFPVVLVWLMVGLMLIRRRRHGYAGGRYGRSMRSGGRRGLGSPGRGGPGFWA